MLKIGDLTPTATQEGRWTDGSIAGGVPPTILLAAWFNAVQDELVHIVESAGIELDKDDSEQVLESLKKLFLSRSEPFADIKADGSAAVAAALSNLGFDGGAKWTKFPDGTIIQRGSVTGYAEYTVTLPVPYSSKDDFVVVITCNGELGAEDGARAFAEAMNTGPGTFTIVCFNAAGMRSPRAVSWIAQVKI